MQYRPILYAFRFHRLSPDEVLAVSETGDYVFLAQPELETLVHTPGALPLERLAELKGKSYKEPKHFSRSAWGPTARVVSKRRPN
jgi:hypothetical protein